MAESKKTKKTQDVKSKEVKTKAKTTSKNTTKVNMTTDTKSDNTKENVDIKGRATGALVCGILSLVLFIPIVNIVLGIIAICLGIKPIKVNSSKDMGVGGVITGSIGTVFGIIEILILIVVFNFVIFGVNIHGQKNYNRKDYPYEYYYSYEEDDNDNNNDDYGYVYNDIYNDITDTWDNIMNKFKDTYVKIPEINSNNK